MRRNWTILCVLGFAVAGAACVAAAQEPKPAGEDPKPTDNEPAEQNPQTKPAQTEPPARPEAKPLPSAPEDPKPTPVEGIEEVKTESGLKYWDIKVGDGQQPEGNAMVTVNYSGWTRDGKLFDSSVKRGSPATFRIDAVFAGMTEGLGSMRVGGKRRLDIPPDLGFGDRPIPGVPPNSSLVFEIELIDLVQPPKQTSVEGITPVVTASGLKYWDIKVGDGISPDASSTVTVHYSGWLTSGTLFDSSVQRGDAATFKLNNVIKGWTEGLTSMKVGGKRRLEIPPGLAYGETAQRGIPADATLIFEVELTDAKLSPKQRSVEGIEPVVTESGLKYWDIKAGTGETPTRASRVKVHYSGWLTDGTLFDSSIERGQPASFPITGVIAGWAEALLTMKVGGIRRLEIPYNLAYKERGGPPKIPPKADLIFDVELLEIVGH